MTRLIRSILPLILLIGLIRTVSVFAQTTPDPVSEQHPVTTGSVMRNPVEQFGAQPQHAEGILGRYFPNIHGGEAIHLDYVYTCGVFNNARGGMRTKGATAYAGIMEIGIGADTEKLGLWKNGTFYMHSFFSHGRNPSRYVGDAQDVAVFAYETPAQGIPSTVDVFRKVA